MENLFILTGPTGIGKSNLSLEIAEIFNGEIISCDSMQIYRQMDIGTAKIDIKSTNIPHHLIDIINPDEKFSVSDYQKICKNKISEINKKNKLPILVGGTGLYINSIVYNLSFQEVSSNLEFRKELSKKIEEEGLDKYYNILIEKDFTAKSIDPNNKNRIIRALEILNFSSNRETQNFREKNTDYNLLYICLNMDRQKLYEKINDRVDIMIEEGLIEEVSNILKIYGENLQSLKAIGYKEIISYLKGNLSREEAIDLIKKNSRNYAKRQLTWFRRDDRIIWLDREDKDLKNKIYKLIKDKYD